MNPFKFVCAVVIIAIGAAVGLSLCDMAKNSYDREEEEKLDE